MGFVDTFECNLHRSFLCDSLGCEFPKNHLSRKFRFENNISWALSILLQHLRPLKFRPGLSFPTHTFRIQLKYSFITPFEPNGCVFYSSLISRDLLGKKMSAANK